MYKRRNKRVKKKYSGQFVDIMNTVLYDNNFHVICTTREITGKEDNALHAKENDNNWFDNSK